MSFLLRNTEKSEPSEKPKEIPKPMPKVKASKIPKVKKEEPKLDISLPILGDFRKTLDLDRGILQLLTGKADKDLSKAEIEEKIQNCFSNPENIKHLFLYLANYIDAGYVPSIDRRKINREKKVTSV